MKHPTVFRHRDQTTRNIVEAAHIAKMGGKCLGVPSINVSYLDDDYLDVT